MAQYYTGLDVSMERTDIVTVDNKGRIIFESSDKTDPQSIDTVLKQAGFPIQKMSFGAIGSFERYLPWDGISRPSTHVVFLLY